MDMYSQVRYLLNEKSEQFLKLSFDLLCIIGFDGYFKCLNPAWEATLGFASQDILSKPLVEWIHPDDRESTLSAFKGKDVIQFENRCICQDGTYKWLLWNSSAVLEENLIYAVVRDITEQKRHEAFLDKTKPIANESPRSESELLVNMSHELRTPIHSVIGYSELLEEKARQHGLEFFVEDLKKINDSGQYLSALIDTLLDISKIEAGMMDVYCESFHIPELLQQIQNIMQPMLLKKQNTLYIQYPHNIGVMHSDITKIRQILLNIASNACKFTEFGEITLKTTVVTYHQSEYISFAIQDTGIGIPASDLNHLFEQFFQVNSHSSSYARGTGLGLAISQKLARLLKGSIQVESQLGKGSNFTLIIPRYLE